LLELGACLTKIIYTQLGLQINLPQKRERNNGRGASQFCKNAFYQAGDAPEKTALI